MVSLPFTLCCPQHFVITAGNASVRVSMKPIHRPRSRPHIATHLFLYSDTEQWLLLANSLTMMKGDTPWIRNIITCTKAVWYQKYLDLLYDLFSLNETFSFHCVVDIHYGIVLFLLYRVNCIWVKVIIYSLAQILLHSFAVRPNVWNFKMIDFFVYRK